MDEEIPLDMVVEAARSRVAALTAEVAGYVLLLLAEQNGDDCRHVNASQIFLSAAGDVRRGAAEPASAAVAEGQLRALLGALLAFSPSPAPALERAAQRPVGGSLERLTGELAAALIPINHAAARRALARLYRETRRLSRSPTPAPVARATSVSVGAPHAAAAAVERVPGTPAEAPVVLAAPPSAAIEPAVWAAPPVATEPAAFSPPSIATEPAVLAAAPPEVEPEPAPALAELDIDVDVEVFRKSSIPPANAQSAFELPAFARHSDVGELLDRFLSDTRSEQRMAAALRELVGLGPVPRKGARPARSSRGETPHQAA